ncbi:cobaltochelatase subunit CobN [Chitinophaga silvisoli]|uniref:Cobaltochelatase subunit CobN n=1 Tax=Chitinophaga silvisoli TaxID=2291814 RepID=A0A3E1NU42_9BACT|nr:cobaltochelatase subunit CobN [Chitinophaga silvisoli]RFM31423.1 cobaltochelatase subunit CobN [Chitinophaga silvisoli]
MKKIVILLWAVMMTTIVTAQVKVSLVLSDNFSQTGAKVKELLKGDCDLHVFSTAAYDSTQAAWLAQSDLVFVYIHASPVFEQVRPQVLKAVAHGAKVYVLGTTPDEEHYKKDGVIFNRKVLSYFAQASLENLRNMVLFCLNKDFNTNFAYKDVISYPENAIYNLTTDSVCNSFESYLAGYKHYKPGRPWIGLYSFRYEYLTGQHTYIDKHVEALEQAGYNVMPFFGFPLVNALKQFGAQLNLLITASSLTGSSTEALQEQFTKMQIPVINIIQLDGSYEEWTKSKTGLSIFARGMYLSRPELSGQIQPTVTSSQELNAEKIVEKTVIPDRVKRLVDRVNALINLQEKPDKDKHIAIIYYSNPPGKDNVGASYLNVLPASMQTILERMRQEGYDLGKDSLAVFNDVMRQGRNIGTWAPAEVERLVKYGHPILVPMEEYQQWFTTLSVTFQKQVIAKWGAPAFSKIMTWRDAQGKAYFVLPAVQYGNIMLMPQPARGWDQDVNTMYHDITLPPHHQYIAFYLYLKYKYKADALIHLGTHGTHEWLSGKETGLNDDDAPEALINNMVNIYPYIVDDVGEGLQAKRRGMAIVIDHMTPPFDSAGLNPQMKELAALINEYMAAKEKSEVLADAKMQAIKALSQQLSLTKEFNKGIQSLEHFVQETGEKQTPFGLHTFGVSPPDTNRNVIASGPAEMNALMDALNGKYIPAGQGNDPIRNPASLPTGKNFYAFDPSKLPSRDVYKAGSDLAAQLIARCDTFPEKVTFNLWSTETIRHEGVIESQILALMGVAPTYDGFGRVSGVQLLPLNRPRVDVVIIPSGLYRDMFPNLMALLDQAVSLVKDADEPDNYVRKHILATTQKLRAQGVNDSLAARLAAVRMFSVPSGAYGTGLEDVIQSSGTWNDETQVSDVYFNRMSHLYGQHFWGDKAENTDSSLPKNLSMQLMKSTLSGTKVVVHSRSSNLYGALDNDDLFQYLGGAAMAIRAIDGKSPEVVITNLSHGKGVQESLDTYIGQELQSRYLNPKWIDKMLQEGYAGGRMINKVVANVWGWQVTVPEAIDENNWQQLYDTYINGERKKQFAEGHNLYAYQVMISRMLETVRKDYWHPDKAVTKKLVKEYIQTMRETGLSCNENVCGNEALSEFVKGQISNQKDLNDYNRIQQKSEQKAPGAQLQFQSEKPGL